MWQVLIAHFVRACVGCLLAIVFECNAYLHHCGLWGRRLGFQVSLVSPYWYKMVWRQSDGPSWCRASAYIQLKGIRKGTMCTMSARRDENSRTKRTCFQYKSSIHAWWSTRFSYLSQQLLFTTGCLLYYMTKADIMLPHNVLTCALCSWPSISTISLAAVLQNQRQPSSWRLRYIIGNSFQCVFGELGYHPKLTPFHDDSFVMLHSF